MSLFDHGFTKDGDSDKDRQGKKRKSREEASKKYEKEKRTRNFVESWRDAFKWVDYDSEGGVMFCVACRKFDSKSEGNYVKGTDKFKRDSLEYHDRSKTHLTCMKKYDIEVMKKKNVTVLTSYTGEVMPTSSGFAASSSGVIEPQIVGPIDIAIRRLNEEERQKLIVCFNTAYFVAKKELPFTLYTDLLALQSQNGVEMPSSYRTDNACRRFMEFIYKDIQEDSYKMMKDAKVLSIMFDGATDVAISENEIVYARVVDSGIPKNMFVGIVSIEHAHAEGVLSGIESVMDSVATDNWNWKEKLVATGSDGASVNLGKKHSVTKLLKDQIPHLVAMHCVSHRLELCALDAMKNREAQVFNDLRSVLLSLHKHYHYSAKALRELQMLAAAMDEKMLKPVNLEGTRWMPHLSSCLKVLLQKYSVFVNHFENTVEGKTGTIDVQSRARNILRHLKSYNLLHYMHFLKDMLSVLSELSLKFQEDRCGLPEATDAIETACLQLVALKHRAGENLQSFLNSVNDEGVFKGVKLTQPTLTAEQLKERQATLIDLVMEHINRRIGDIDSGHLMKDMQIFYPVNLPVTEVERAVYGEDELNALCDYYQHVLTRMGCDIEHMKRTEWPGLKVHMNRQPRNISVQEFYHRLFSNPNLKETFKNVIMLANIILCIPVSSAVCERGFSAMARIKSDWRASLNIEMLNYLMAISIQGPNPTDYNAERALAMWWHGGQRARRPDFDNP